LYEKGFLKGFPRKRICDRSTIPTGAARSGAAAK
jgi:hypothetical protein